MVCPTVKKISDSIFFLAAAAAAAVKDASSSCIRRLNRTLTD